MRFVMVDRVLELDPGERILASKTMSRTEPLFEDHFPGFPVIPAVLLTEMMAQAGGKCLFAGDPDRGYPVLVRVKDATFRHWVEPEQNILVIAEVVTSTDDYASVRCHAEVDKKRVCRADLSFSFLPKEQLGGTPAIFSLETMNHGES